MDKVGHANILTVISDVRAAQSYGLSTIDFRLIEPLVVSEQWHERDPASHIIMLEANTLAFTKSGEGDPALIFLHALGGSGRAWQDVMSRLHDRYQCIAIDLPGFGNSADHPGYPVEQMMFSVLETLRNVRADSLWLVGHSMGAKVAVALARLLEDSDDSRLRGLMLFAGSPPAPEPIEQGRREEMLSWFDGDAADSLKQAEKFVKGNTSSSLDKDVNQLLVNDVLRTNHAAWTAWLQHGSKEDWSQRVGVLNSPTLIVAGGEDGDLGEDAQRSLMAPHFAEATIRVVAGAKHLLPAEAPQEVATLIAAHMSQPEMQRQARAVSASYRELFESNRVSHATRAALDLRARADDPAYTPQTLSVEHLAVLRALLERVIPQLSEQAIDLAARIDRDLTHGAGQGWRYAQLPERKSAYSRGLDTLESAAKRACSQPFVALEATQQDDLLQQMADGKLAPDILQRAAQMLHVALPAEAADALDAKQMQRWFEDLRADAVRLYMAHPATLARIGYSGFADGSEAIPGTGFVQIAEGEREAWEPPITSLFVEGR